MGTFSATSPRAFEPSYFENRSQTQKMVYLTPRSEKCVYDQTLYGEKPLEHTFEVPKSICPFDVMDNCDFSKNVLKKCCFFNVFDLKNVKKKKHFLSTFIEKSHLSALRILVY